ncbi:hypothetical protein B10328_07750 [Campylobacter coli]|nr:hypothetical protein B10328_07750 [Campylobacter coli]
MRILKILYICWIILCVVGWFISPIVGHNPDRFKEFLIVIGWIILPPISSQSMVIFNNKN